MGKPHAFSWTTLSSAVPGSRPWPAVRPGRPGRALTSAAKCHRHFGPCSPPCSCRSPPGFISQPQGRFRPWAFLFGMGKPHPLSTHQAFLGVSRTQDVLPA